VTGVAITPGVAVIATATIDGVTNVDTTVVAVTATRAWLKTFSVQPLLPPYENPTVAMNSYNPLQIVAKDSAGNSVFGLAIRYATSDPTHGLMMGTLFNAKSPGPVDVIASTMSYGVTYVDTLHYMVTHIKQITVQISSSVKTYMSVIGTNGNVTWQNMLTVPVSIEFGDDAAGVGGGHIPSLSPGMIATRSFPAAGTYTWRNTAGTESGTVIVLQD
jgi:hypothetical protein